MCRSTAAPPEGVQEVRIGSTTKQITNDLRLNTISSHHCSNTIPSLLCSLFALQNHVLHVPLCLALQHAAAPRSEAGGSRPSPAVTPSLGTGMLITLFSHLLFSVLSHVPRPVQTAAGRAKPAASPPAVVSDRARNPGRLLSCRKRTSHEPSNADERWPARGEEVLQRTDNW